MSSINLVDNFKWDGNISKLLDIVGGESIEELSGSLYKAMSLLIIYSLERANPLILELEEIFPDGFGLAEVRAEYESILEDIVCRAPDDKYDEGFVCNVMNHLELVGDEFRVSRDCLIEQNINGYDLIRMNEIFDDFKSTGRFLLESLDILNGHFEELEFKFISRDNDKLNDEVEETFNRMYAEYVGKKCW